MSRSSRSTESIPASSEGLNPASAQRALGWGVTPGVTFVTERLPRTWWRFQPVLLQTPGGPCSLEPDRRIELAMTQALIRPLDSPGSFGLSVPEQPAGRPAAGRAVRGGEQARVQDRALKGALATSPRLSRPTVLSAGVGPSLNEHSHSFNDPCNYLG